MKITGLDVKTNVKIQLKWNKKKYRKKDENKG